MNTPISAQGDNLDSAIKLTLILEALAKASAELEKTVNILADQLSRFNLDLDQSLRSEVQAARTRMGAALKQNLDGLLKDKESAVKALSEFKQAEIEKVILTGKTVRSGLSSQVEDATRAISAAVSGKIIGIKEHLDRPEAEMKSTYEELKLALETAISQAQNQLSNSKIAEQNLIVNTSKDFDSKVLEALDRGQQDFNSNLSQKQSELGALNEKVSDELAHKFDEIIGRLEDSYQEGRLVLKQNNEQAESKLKQLSNLGAAYFVEQEKTFQDTITSLSGVLNGLYETRLNNLAAQSRTEIVSAAQYAEECLATSKLELQACLKEFQRDYVAQFEALHSKLEKTLDELAKKKESGAMQGLKEERVREQLHSLFRRLGQEMIDSAAGSSARLELDFQKSMDAFEQRIETARIQACESLGRESSLMQKELTLSFQEFDKQLAELQVQASKLEKAGLDAANFVMTIRQANLDF